MPFFDALVIKRAILTHGYETCILNFRWTITQDTIMGTNYGNHSKLSRTRKLWYLLLRNVWPLFAFVKGRLGTRNCLHLRPKSQRQTLTFQTNCLICFKESPLKVMKNAFYFILKALFILRIFKSTVK